MFRHSQELLQEMVLAERLWLLFLEIVKEIGEILEIDVTELIEKIIWCEKTENLISQFLMLNSPSNKAA